MSMTRDVLVSLFFTQQQGASNKVKRQLPEIEEKYEMQGLLPRNILRFSVIITDNRIL